MEGAPLWRDVTFRIFGGCSGLDFAQLHSSAGPAAMTEVSDIWSARS